MATHALEQPIIVQADALPAVRPRLDAIDILRGAVMVLMALDHTRAFFSNARFNPEDLTQTTAALFFTRWITHFCAPVFVFLAGTGAFLHADRGKTKAQLAWFLVTRGLWLVVLEFTLVHLAWFLNWRYELVIAQVIWAIGWSMVLLAPLVFLPAWAVTIVGVVLICGHNVLDNLVDPSELGWFQGTYAILRGGGFLRSESGFGFLAAYPVLPWLGVMAAGYGFGMVWRLDPSTRRRWLLGLGLAITSLFVLLRAINVYGDPQPWSEESSGVFTVMSFLRCRKYPPSLLYVLMTLGPAILALAWLDRGVGVLGRPFVVFGRVPLFYYLLHVPVIHAVAFVLALARYGESGFLFNHPSFVPPNELPPGYGYDLPMVYLIWIGVVLILYPPCVWFAALKRRRRDVWLSYF
jgi:uncharacterized membrane protein